MHRRLAALAATTIALTGAVVTTAARADAAAGCAVRYAVTSQWPGGFGAAVDVTNLGSEGRWRELLSGAGVRSAAISGSGVFRDAATDERARAIFFAGEIPAYQVIIPDFGVIEGPFQITSIEYSGSHDGEAVYELALASAGPVSFAAI